MMGDDDSISVDTTSAVSEPEPRNSSGMMIPFLALGTSNDAFMKEEKVEFDAAPVYRQMEKRKCQEVDCPNNGSGCKMHGKLRLTCKVKGCQYFVQEKGFCNEHGNLCPIKDPSLGGEKEDGDTTSVTSQKKRKNSDDGSSKKKRKKSDKSAPSKPPPPRGPTNEDIILSMLDNKYKRHMQEHFRNIEQTKEKVSVVGERILKEFKAQLKSCKGAALLKKSGKIYVEASDEVALKKIKADLQDRHKTTSWRTSPGNCENVGKVRSEKATLTRKLSDDSDGTLESLSKKQKKSQGDVNNNPTSPSSIRRTRNSAETTLAVTGSTCHDNPLSYVGNYVAELLKKEGWSNRLKKVDSINFGQVICRPGCNIKTGVEGEDKFTGYEAIAKWAYKTGYYKENIVEADDDKARLVLYKANILDDPYSIFKDVQRDDQEGEDSNPLLAAAAQAPSQRSKSANAVAMEQPSAAGEAAPDSAAPVKIRDEDTNSPNKKSIVAFASSTESQDYWRIFERIETSLMKATTENDQDSIDFHGHLLSYLESKAERLDFSLGSDKDIIDQVLALFEAAKEKYKRAIRENRPGKKSYKRWLTMTINDCKKEFPLV